MNSNMRTLSSYITNLILIILAWKLLSLATGDLLPSPVETITWMYNSETLASIIYNTLITLRNSLAGFSIALFLAVITVLASKIHGILEGLVESLNVYVQSISALIWILVFLVLFGFKSPLPPMLVTTGVAYPILLSNLISGIKTVDSKIIDLSELLGASKIQLFKHVYIPASVPYTIAGSRAALGASLRISVVAEAFGSSGGIGYKLTYYFDLYNYKGMMAWALFLVVLMILLDKLVLEPLEDWSKRWLP
ncbi:MAG: ABC transporter permease subunit [Desulfurococcales archaeon]|nr:ABC transporter permease subunit [Desulfurococcales archaeon]